MDATPDELRSEVEARRAHLAHNVDRLADRITPSRVAHRQADAARSKLTGIKERVMGTAHDTGTAAHRATAAAGTTAAQIGDTVQQTPAQLRRQTQGSPLAAGIIAFGAGLLAAALLPTSKAEERGGAMLRDHPELLEPVKQAATQAARDVRDEMREPATDALQAVKSTAQDAVDSSRSAAQDAGRRTAGDLKATGQEAAQEIRRPTT
ncbi:DUF3618 domain-containing protein [Kitasatospora sp. NPDC093679]|uniref:DUF3618 domain-containing protein n=1 Tax=Kitasatospora sp. NPDC093679 TaxID=3154983 RepID=UPI003445E70B